MSIRNNFVCIKNVLVVCLGNMPVKIMRPMGQLDIHLPDSDTSGTANFINGVSNFMLMLNNSVYNENNNNNNTNGKKNNQFEVFFN